MNCCRSYEACFDQATARQELQSYRRKGPSKTTRHLLNLLKRAGVEKLTLLDIGGGIGAIQHELLRAGAGSAVQVDASTAYLEASSPWQPISPPKPAYHDSSRSPDPG